MNKLVSNILAVALIIAAAIAIGIPSIHGTFLNGDDQRFIIENALVNHPSWSNTWTLITSIHSDLYQPVPMLSFQANYALAGPDPTGQFPVSAYGFRLTNILLHALNSVLVYLLASRIARCRRVALLTAILFAVHPYASEPVGWICGRMILLGTTFALLTLIICLRADLGTSTKARWTAIICWIFSLGSKVMPTVPLVAMYLHLRSTAACPLLQNQKSKIQNFLALGRRALFTYTFMLLLAAIATIAAFSAAGKTGLLERTDAELTTSAPVRVLLASRYYFENYLWPARLAAWNPPPENVPFQSTPVFIAIGEWLIFGALLLWTQRRARLSFDGLIIFLILLAPFLAATLARRGLTADRYMYLPSVGLHFAVAAGVVQIADLWQKGAAARAFAIRYSPYVICTAIALCLFSYSRHVGTTWTTTIARDRRLVEVYPNHVEVRAELAKAYIFEKQIDNAFDVLTEARRKWPDSPRLALQAGMAHRMQNNWSAAEVELAKAAAGMPHKARTRYYYARTLEMTEKKSQACAEYEAILALDPDYVPALLSLAQLSIREGKTGEADLLLQKIIALAPYQRDALFELANLRIRQRNWAAAEQLLRSILELDAQDRPTLLNLGVALVHQGRPADALEIYSQLLAIEPDALSPRLNRAALYESLNQPALAESDFRFVLLRYPENRQAAVGFHQLLARQSRGKELIALWLQYGPKCCTQDEVAVWRTWAYMIDNQPELARKMLEKITPTNPHREFGNWAIVWDSLRKNSSAEILPILGPFKRIDRPLPAQPDYSRTILDMLAALPRETRNSPVAIYSLARALAYENPAAAVKTAEQLANQPDPNPFRQAAQDLLLVLRSTAD